MKALKSFVNEFWIVIVCVALGIFMFASLAIQQACVSQADQIKKAAVVYVIDTVEDCFDIDLSTLETKIA